LTEELAYRKIMECMDRKHVRKIWKYLVGVKRSEMKKKMGEGDNKLQTAKKRKKTLIT
jgi:hypothetical protein